MDLKVGKLNVTDEEFYDMFTRPLVGDHMLNYLAWQIKDMLRDPLASQKLASLVGEVVTVVVQQVIPSEYQLCIFGRKIACKAYYLN